ncbi:MAG: NnrS family protein [Rhodoferax sp.]|nr:NnrS family protein [Rhodoferax sp.]
MTLLMGWLALRWGLVQSLKIRILAMFHGGFVWLGLSFAFNAVSHGLMAYRGDTVSLGLAPLHAMTMGYLGATMFAMVTRVSSGHGGRKQPADNVAWTLYWVLQLAVVLRVVAATVLDWSVFLLLCAAGAWCVVAVSWFVRYGSWFGTPRADGRPE